MMMACMDQKENVYNLQSYFRTKKDTMTKIKKVKYVFGPYIYTNFSF